MTAMEKQDVLTRAFDALEKIAASFGQTAAEYWPQWVGRCILAAWLKFGIVTFLTLSLVGLGWGLCRYAKGRPTSDAAIGGYVSFVVALVLFIAVLVLGYHAILQTAYPEIEAAKTLLGSMRK